MWLIRYLQPREPTCPGKLTSGELPITSTGKTDRKRLREIGGSFSIQKLATIQTAVQATKRQPTTQAELEMRRIWSKVLNIDPSTIGLDDSFFSLGGDSISAMKVVGEARNVGVEITVAEIFQHVRLGRVANNGVSLADNTPEDISPFALLSPRFDIPSLLRDISLQYQIESTAIEDIYPCTPLQEGLFSLSLKQRGECLTTHFGALSRRRHCDLPQCLDRCSSEDTHPAHKDYTLQ